MKTKEQLDTVVDNSMSMSMTPVATTPVKKSNWGGARPGAGRPPGSLSKISAKLLLESIDERCGKPFAEQLAINYTRAIEENNNMLVAKYDQMFLDKLVADKSQVDITSDGQAISAPTIQFIAAVTGQDYKRIN